MATTVIHDACEAGALAGMLMDRDQTGATAASYAVVCAAATAVATDFITFNAASGAAIADADKASIGPIIQAIATGVLAGRAPLSAVAGAYANYAADIYYLAKEAIAVGGLT